MTVEFRSLARSNRLLPTLKWQKNIWTCEPCSVNTGLFSKGCGLRSQLRVTHLFSLSSKWRWAQAFPQGNTIRLLNQLLIPSECLRVCSSVASHACMYALVDKQTQVFWCFPEHTGPLQPWLQVWLMTDEKRLQGNRFLLFQLIFASMLLLVFEKV